MGPIGKSNSFFYSGRIFGHHIPCVGDHHPPCAGGQHSLAKGIHVFLVQVTIIYLLANFAYFSVLTPTELLASNAVAVVGVKEIILNLGFNWSNLEIKNFRKVHEESSFNKREEYGSVTSLLFKKV